MQIVISIPMFEMGSGRENGNGRFHCFLLRLGSGANNKKFGESKFLKPFKIFNDSYSFITVFLFHNERKTSVSECAVIAVQ